MISYEELNTQNDKITELSNVLSVLIQERSICDSETCCNIFYDYMDQVKTHIYIVDTSLYTDLLGHSSSEANNTANNFMAGSQEIKKIMNAYLKKWCDKKCRELSIGAKHELFLQDTDDMFEIILSRIQNEMEHLYPMARKIANG